MNVPQVVSVYDVDVDVQNATKCLYVLLGEEESELGAEGGSEEASESAEVQDSN